MTMVEFNKHMQKAAKAAEAGKTVRALNHLTAAGQMAYDRSEELAQSFLRTREEAEMDESAKWMARKRWVTLCAEALG